MSRQLQDIIGFLEQSWHDMIADVSARHPSGHPFGPTPEASAEKLEELRREFRDELAQMSPDQLKTAALDVMDQQDQARPFNDFGTDADYEHFGKCPYLTPDEAVALSFGKDPRVVNWEMVKPYLGRSRFAYRYASLLDRVDRAIIWQELPPKFAPLTFLTWAHQYKEIVPDAFVQSTFVRGEPIRYWHDLCGDLDDVLTETVAELDAARQALAKLQAENEQREQRTFDQWWGAQDEINKLQQEIFDLKAPPKVEEDMQPKERTSCLKLIAGMAADAYAFDPRVARSSTAREISEGLSRFGIELTDETVRKNLALATEFIDTAKLEDALRKPKSKAKSPKR